MVSSAKQCLGQRLVWWTEKRHVMTPFCFGQIQPQEANIFFSLFVSERHGVGLMSVHGGKYHQLGISIQP